MESQPIPYKSIVFVCTNARAEGERVSCAAAGRCGALLREKLREEVAKRGLKGLVRVSSSGCMNKCEEGPNVMVFDGDGEQAWYKKVSEADVPEILAEHFPK